ncbi:Voltage-gated potassium channel subunit beta-2 [Chionoecetes opilio]|uniref:Voltage-gated potassium channel subunit beta-2 n=1 Tax=Chionoecetes opilio TaxID=41210 RepID=A0A8J4YT09_CHIOP|nr:Voltage-gated potassium channel subunit beta-2 [Chionoecetes opilio]
MLSAAMGGSARLSQPDVRSPLYMNPEMREESRRAPIASLECMEEFPSCGEPIQGHGDSQQQLGSRTSQGISGAVRYKPLGKSGLRVSQLGLGAWVTFSPQVTEEVAEQVITVAYDCGINVFDLSESYSGGRAEVQLGNILKKKGWRRSSYHVLTKVYWNAKGDERGLSRKHIIESVKTSLDRLGLEYVDVMIIHKADDMCPMEEVVRACHYCIEQGLAMYWGTSRWSAVEIMEAWTNCRQFNCITPIVEQSEYHLFCRGKTELYLPEMYNKIGVGTMAWSPLAIGLISSKIDEGTPVFTRQSFKGYTWLKDKTGSEDHRKQQARLRELYNLAEELGCTLTQLSVAWSLKNENLHCVLIGASSVEQLLENLQSLQVATKLRPEHLTELERILDNKPVRPPMVSTLTQR